MANLRQKLWLFWWSFLGLSRRGWSHFSPEDGDRKVLWRLASTTQSTRRINPKDHHQYRHRHKNLKSHKLSDLFIYLFIYYLTPASYDVVHWHFVRYSSHWLQMIKKNSNSLKTRPPAQSCRTFVGISVAAGHLMDGSTLSKITTSKPLYSTIRPAHTSCNIYTALSKAEKHTAVSFRRSQTQNRSNVMKSMLIDYQRVTTSVCWTKYFGVWGPRYKYKLWQKNH